MLWCTISDQLQSNDANVQMDGACELYPILVV